ncbi:MAG: xanthine dehydrogenase small subunit [Proteobacteria bacterium]|nr:xanthine dehydrogenase small subunit [Pseudomonadota bacterium]
MAAVPAWYAACIPARQFSGVSTVSLASQAPDTDPGAPPCRPIRFVHRGQVQEVAGLPPTTTVLQWLREHARCSGTKEGCAEGDCGACTVVVGALDAQGVLQRHTVNACIQLLPMLDGKALFTVEDVTAQGVAQGVALHPCQQALVDCHGSQCGFCTPGFVMSLWQVYERHATPLPRIELAEALAGNLCRCTGYRPILDAGERMHDAPRQTLDTAPTVALLQGLAAQPPLHHAGPSQHFHAPRTLAELAALRLALPEATLLAGATDIGLWVTKQFRPLGDIVHLGRVAELQAITRTSDGSPDGTLLIGAGASLEAAWQALSMAMPELRELWKRFASPPVRHAGTLGGNLANGSPIGDSAPVLLALDARLLLRRGARLRELPLSAFYLGHMRNALEAGEFLQAIRVPLPAPAPREVLRAYKVSKRRDSDIATLCAGLWLRLEGETITAARLGWGGMAATACRAPQAEAALVGQPWNEATLRRAQAALALDFHPIDDLRASAAYRRQAAAGLLERFWLETRAQQPLPPEQVQVWPARPSAAPGGPP